MQVFETLAATWPPAAAWRVGPWTLRDGAGGGRRVSAATLDGPLDDPEMAAAAMRDRGQAPLFLVRTGERALDARLAGLGYRLIDPVVMMQGDTAALALERPDEFTIFCEGPVAALAEVWAAAGIGPPRLAVMARVSGPRVYLLGRVEESPAGAAFAACHQRLAMLHALEVAPWARGRGLGQRLMRAAAHWALAQGATRLSLAVMADNAAALALYRKLGFRAAGGYHYRVAP